VTTELKVELFEPYADPDQVDELAQHLRLELLELDVESVSPVTTGPAPDGSKGLELAAIGALLVHVAGSANALTSVIQAMRSWLRREAPAKRSITVSIGGNTLELTSATDAQQQQLVEQFVRAVSGAS
jgi:hypothetical protein